MTWLRVFVAVGVVAVLGACDDDDPVGLEPGTIQVEVTTSGEGTDDDGFTVSLDGGAVTEAIDVDGSVTLENVEAGTHSVELTDLAATCTVDGDNPQTVEVESFEEETVSFSVTCTASS